MRKQYHLRPSSHGYMAWDVDLLIKLSEKLPLIKYPVADIKEINEPYWYQDIKDIPTVKSIIEHIKLVEEANLDFPIIIANDGRVMDGMHRVAKAVLNDQKFILAKKFTNYVPPDFVDVYPEDLEYGQNQKQ